MEKLLTIDEVSEITKIKKSTLRAWVFQRRIPCVRIGGRLVRFQEGDIEKWIRMGSSKCN